MGLKDDVMQALTQGDVRALANLTVREGRAVRHVVGRLWDPEETIRARAARAIGLAAREDERFAVEISRRLLWGLNDESGTNGIYGVPALGEIGREAPETFRPFASPFASFAEDPGLRTAILRAFVRISETAPALGRSVASDLRRHVDFEDDTQREAYESLMRTLGDTHE